MKPIDWEEQARLDEEFLSHITDPELREFKRNQLDAHRRWSIELLAGLPKRSPWQECMHDLKIIFRPNPKWWHYRFWWMAENWNPRKGRWE